MVNPLCGARCVRALVLGLLLALIYPAYLQAQAVGETTIGGVWYLNYQVGEAGDESFNRFGISRGYINFKHTLNERWSGRITPDVTQDSSGDVKVRLKYAYGKVKLDDMGFLTSPNIEMGIAHRPWLDYEEHINLYRSQGTMYLERNHLFNSADFGATFFALLGGEVDETYQEEVSHAYPGRWGSLAFGVYNGGGYHAQENNENKSVEGRLSIRPFPDAAPGLQVVYNGIYSKGNTEDAPDFTVNTLFASYENQHLALTAQRYWGKGDQKGNYVDGDGSAVDQDGISIFGEWKIPGPNLSIIGRYDLFDSEDEGHDSERIIAGLAYHIQGRTMLMVDYDIESSNGFDDIRTKVLKMTLEYHF